MGTTLGPGTLGRSGRRLGAALRPGSLGEPERTLRSGALGRPGRHLRGALSAGAGWRSGRRLGAVLRALGVLRPTRSAGLRRLGREPLCRRRAVLLLGTRCGRLSLRRGSVSSEQVLAFAVRGDGASVGTVMRRVRMRTDGSLRRL